MQVITETRQVQRMNVQNEHAFTIKASAKAFSVLTNNLYSDKPLAIVRELCCNAYDSHVAAGKKDVPIEVILPTRLNPQLVIKDFGTGLDHEEMIDIYTKFFESTKTESNEFVGQLGLGSKSPFAMFKSFSVEARKDGVKRVYTAFLNEEGVPTIAQMGEEVIDEPNGVTVTMAVKSDDFDKFNNAAKRALMYFDPKPVVNGVHSFSTFSVKHGVGGSNWKLRESDYWARMNGPYVVQGFVVYPIDGSLIKEHELSQAARVIAELNLDFWMDIGSVDVAPSREALSYDKRTIANIKAAFENAAVEMRTVIQDEFNTSKTAYEAGCKLHKYEQTGDWSMRRLFEGMHKDAPFTWNGKPITYKHVLDTTKIRTTIIARAQSSGRKLQYSSRYEPTTIEVKREIPLNSATAVLIDDLVRGSSDILKQFLDDSKNGASAVVVLKATKKAEYNEKEIKGIIKMLGNVPVQKVSELPYKAGVHNVNKSTRGKEDRLRFTKFPKGRDRWSDSPRRTFSRLTWETVTVDLSKGGFYVPIERFDIIWNGKVQTHFDVVLDAAVSLGLITEADKMNTYGFNEKEMKKVAGDRNWKNLFEHLTTQFNKLNVVENVILANGVGQLNSKMENFNRYIGAKWLNVSSQINDGMFKTFINKVRTLGASVDTDNLDEIRTFVNVMGFTDLDIVSKSDAKAKELIAEWNKVRDAHSMLSMIDWYRVDSSNVKMIIDYINVLAVK